MNIKYFAHAAAALALGVATLITPGKIQGQGPMYDRVEVNLPYTVTIGDKTLQPGNYVIQQMQSTSGNSRVLLIYSDNGMKFETTAMTIPALDPNTARDTRVMLHHFGNDYYFDKVWIQGKDYGYEFPLPNNGKQREKEEMQPVSVAANYSSTPAEAATNQQTTPPATQQQTTAATQQQTTAATQQQTTAATQEQTTAATQQQTTAATQQQTTAATQQQQTAATQPQTMPPATHRQTATTQSTEANREAPAMPKTSADWLLMLIGGGSLSGLGMALRRR
jgi:hypothetical protein